jgi:DNA (cytosine-5)-methyltransferase 1
VAIPVIDIFAGPGGLGEGFSALHDKKGKRVFKIVLSIEKDKIAHQTLTLRSFIRQFDLNKAPNDYYEFLQGNISFKELFRRYPNKAELAKAEAWKAELGYGKDAVSNEEVDSRINEALKGQNNWLLIGGPPCQAYSVVGRSRRQETILDEKTDSRVGLYKQYLRILAVHNPSVFVMENVKGLLSAKTADSSIFNKILSDLSNPVEAYLSEFNESKKGLICPGYKIYSLSSKSVSFDEKGNPVFNPKDFIIYSEKYGIPQTRHRVILLGVRRDLALIPESLELANKNVPIAKIITGLPRLRGGLSKSINDFMNWRNAISRMLELDLFDEIPAEVLTKMLEQFNRIRNPRNGIGDEYIPSENISIDYMPEWFIDKKIGGVCNHHSRSHMSSDLQRYFFASCYTKVYNNSPNLKEFPLRLLPNHHNVNEGIDAKIFADRFRVQIYQNPCKTITSHISKDGHYYIHPDPTQCRSFTVREAARIQTFPDNYFFCGERTSQFHQVGNAVPPYLAYQIAKIVNKIFYKA